MPLVSLSYTVERKLLDLISGATRFAREVVVHSELLKLVVRNLNRP